MRAFFGSCSLLLIAIVWLAPEIFRVPILLHAIVFALLVISEAIRERQKS